ncbi:MAG: hypothetical protein HKN48_02880 [Flavobacteriaceae bacterium]|nr:hypothetical protein [Flavobacteriaceae bacterium]
MLTQKHTYGIFFFTALAVLFPAIIENPKIVVANLFCMLALRRIISLQSDKNDEKKILDASLWIFVASFFYFWSLWFFVALYLALIIKPITYFRYYLIPVIAGLAVFLMATAYTTITKDSFVWIPGWVEAPNFDFSVYQAPKTILVILLILGIIVLTAFNRVWQIKSIPKKDRPNYLLIVQVLVVAFLTCFFSPHKTTAELLFLAVPSAIILSGYVEKLSNQWLTELILWIFILTPIVFIFV